MIDQFCGEAEGADRARTLGAVGFLAKPHDTGQLRSAIRGLERSALQAHIRFGPFAFRDVLERQQDGVSQPAGTSNDAGIELQRPRSQAGDLALDVPAGSQVHHQVVRKPHEARDIEIDPIVHPYYIEVEQPDMHDPSGDLERVLGVGYNGGAAGMNAFYARMDELIYPRPIALDDRILRIVPAS